MAGSLSSFSSVHKGHCDLLPQKSTTFSVFKIRFHISPSKSPRHLKLHQCIHFKPPPPRTPPQNKVIVNNFKKKYNIFQFSVSAPYHTVHKPLTYKSPKLHAPNYYRPHPTKLMKNATYLVIQVSTRSHYS